MRLWAFLILFLPSLLSAQGVVVVTVPEASAPEKAGVRAGDVFHAWTRLANPPVHPEPASGSLESHFDWHWMEYEQAPRGLLVLHGERQGEPLVLQVPVGRWEAKVRPVLPADLEDLYRRGKELVDREQFEEGTGCWRQLAERAEERGDWRLQAWTWLSIAWAWQEASDYQRAETAFEAALRASRDPLSRFTVLDEMGGIFPVQKRFDDAEAIFRSSLALSEATWGESLHAALSQSRLGWAAWHRAAASGQRHHWAAAEAQIEAALASEKKWAPEGIATARLFYYLGSIARQQGDLDKAMLCFEKSLAISRVLEPASPYTAEVLASLSAAADENGEHEKAEAAYRQALSALGQTPSPSLSNVLQRLGDKAVARGDWTGAEDYYRRALAMRSKLGPESPQIPILLISLSEMAAWRLDLDSAEEYLKKALGLLSRASPGSRYVGLTLIQLSAGARQRGDLASAERYLRDALAFRRQHNSQDPHLDDEIWRSLGDLALERGDLAAAEDYYRRRPKMGWNEADSLKLSGEIALRRGDLEKAENDLREYLADAQTRFDAGAFQALADILRQRGRLREASRYAALSIEKLEAQIEKIGGTQEAKGKVRAREGDIYRDALRLQLELNHPREAFHLLERFRAHAFLTLLAQRDLDFTTDLSPRLDQERRRLAASYDRNQLRLAELDPEKDGAAIEALRRDQIQLRRRREEIAEEVRRTAPRLASLQSPQALAFEPVREALDPGTVMLSYSVGKQQTHLFLVGRGRDLQVKTLAVGRQDLENDVDRFRKLIDQTQAGSGLGKEGLGWFSRRLYHLLIEPAEPEIAAADRIVLVPDGPLHRLPFAALIRPDGRYLVESKPLSTVLSGTVLAELKKRREAHAAAEPSSRQWVAFGDPWFPPRLAQSRAEEIGEVRLRAFSTRAQLRWTRLPESRREVEGIASMFSTDRRQTYLDRDATEEHAKAVGKSARIVHFATHAFVDDRSPFDSGLVLSIPEDLTEGRDNGLLQVWEIFESVRLDADLVVLSACETGSGEVRGGEGIIGLTRAFQYAGARSVLASLWRVEDGATAELMQRFYRHLKAGKAKDEALRAAQLELIKHPVRLPDGRGGWTERNAAAPYFWAALQLVGDGL